MANNSWTCVHVDMPESFELVRVQSRKNQLDTGKVVYEYFVITYYDGKELFSGSRKACQKWINDHYVNRRYTEIYGQS